MMADKDMIIFIAIMSIVTFLTRLSAFLLPNRIAQTSLVQNSNRTLPPAILTLLIIYSVKDSIFGTALYGLPEVVSILVVVAVHLWRRNALVSIFSGTLVFMICKQSGLLT